MKHKLKRTVITVTGLLTFMASACNTPHDKGMPDTDDGTSMHSKGRADTTNNTGANTADTAAGTTPGIKP